MRDNFCVSISSNHRYLYTLSITPSVTVVFLFWQTFWHPFTNYLKQNKIQKTKLEFFKCSVHLWRGILTTVHCKLIQDFSPPLLYSIHLPPCLICGYSSAPELVTLSNCTGLKEATITTYTHSCVMARCKQNHFTMDSWLKKTPENKTTKVLNGKIAGCFIFMKKHQ